MHVSLNQHDYEPIDYGIKLHVCAEVWFEGCYGGCIDGFVLTHIDSPDIMDVTLIREAPRDPRTLKRLGEDEPGSSLGVSRGLTDAEEDRKFFRRHLMSAAQSEIYRNQREEAWTEWKSWERFGRAADAEWDRREGWVQ